ncbi:MAG: response regulator transcription factor [Lachnospiraceae bacterium]|nr:response regulator transcription factor [Lachnospiraceae bacterium]MBQ2426701.1 response regulator transcription factor [Lachnospiraceae bacterium]
MAKKIYVADDEKNICFLIQNFLEKEGFEVTCFHDGESILEACEKEMPDLCILDVMMPGMDGLTVCTQIRKRSHVPIIIVSAKDSPLDRITGITLGSDDYLVKPFLPLELVTRVKALFRRVDAFAGPEEETKDTLEFGDIILYTKRRAAQLRGADFALTPLEFDFLNHMLEHPEHAASRDDLLKALWKVDSKEVDTRAVDDMVKRLRKKLKEQGSTVKIETVWGYGFRLIAGGE